MSDPVSPELKEEIARIIDPLWAELADEISRIDAGTSTIQRIDKPGPQIMKEARRDAASRKTAALAKAEQIITALNRRADTASGGRGGGTSSVSLPAHASPLRSAAATPAQHSAGFEVHVLKTHPEPFAAVRARKKWLEIRRHDRDFKEGDTLWLDEYDAAADVKTGEVEVRIVTHVLPGGQYGIEPGFCAISMADIPSSSETVSPQSEAKPSAGSLARDEPPSSPPPNPVGDEVGEPS